MQPCRHARPAAAAPEAIDRMDEALGWLMWLEPEERQLVWLRAEGLPWKWITRRLGHRPHHGMAAVDHGAAQDRGPARHGRTEPSEHQTTEQLGRFCATKRVASDEVRAPPVPLRVEISPPGMAAAGFALWSRRCLCKPPVHRPAGVRSAAEVKRALDRQRPSAARRGYGPRWRRARAAFLAQHPLCAACRGPGPRGAGDGGRPS